MALKDAKGTTPATGDLTPITDCYLIIGNVPHMLNGREKGQIVFNNLPDISDQKGVSYADENGIGRSLPSKTFSHGENRSISVTASFYILKTGDDITNLSILRAIQSAVYPRDGSGALPYIPPPLCKLKCGKLLSNESLCVIMKDYNVKFPTDVPWHQTTYVPYKMEISMNFDVVYPSSKLPGQEQIVIDFPKN
jgi:hypothetical protein